MFVTLEPKKKHATLHYNIITFGKVNLQYLHYEQKPPCPVLASLDTVLLLTPYSLHVQPMMHQLEQHLLILTVSTLQMKSLLDIVFNILIS